jgi:hypothetical protein
MDFYKDTPYRCRLLLITAYIALLASVVLNGYLVYEIGYYFSQDGFSFLGGLFIAVALPFTIALTIITRAMINNLRKKKKKTAVFFLVLSISGMLAGAILHNATFLWVYILLLSFVLLLASILCLKDKKA